MRVVAKHSLKVGRPRQPRLAQTLGTPKSLTPCSIAIKHKGRPLSGSPFAQTFSVGNLFNVVEIAKITLERETSWGLH
jgi:hypothetical protein